jgi:uracil-DNA glycosylase
LNRVGKRHYQLEFTKPYFAQIKHFLSEQKAAGKTIFPPGPLIFNAFDKTPFAKVRVVILGQDPYPGPGPGNGIMFFSSSSNTHTAFTQKYL